MLVFENFASHNLKFTCQLALIEKIQQFQENKE